MYKPTFFELNFNFKFWIKYIHLLILVFPDKFAINLKKINNLMQTLLKLKFLSLNRISIVLYTKDRYNLNFYFIIRFDFISFIVITHFH